MPELSSIKKQTNKKRRWGVNRQPPPPFLASQDLVAWTVSLASLHSPAIIITSNIVIAVLTSVLRLNRNHHRCCHPPPSLPQHHHQFHRCVNHRHCYCIIRATTASPKPSFRAPWRVGDAVVDRGKDGWTTSKSGHPCLHVCQNSLQCPPAEKKISAELSVMSPQRHNRSKNWTELNHRRRTRSHHFTAVVFFIFISVTIILVEMISEVKVIIIIVLVISSSPPSYHNKASYDFYG